MSTYRTSDIGLVSADSHVDEPRDLWSSNLPLSMREQAMRGIEAGDDGGWSLVLDAANVFHEGDDEVLRLRPLDPDYRFEVMRSEGVVAECIFPTIGLYVWMLRDPVGGELSCRIYNDWILDTLQRHSARFSCAGLVPTWSVEMACAEVERIAEMGLGSVMIPALVEPMWNHRQWQPLWERIEATRLPVVIHQGTGHEMVFHRGPGATVANLVATQAIAPRVATMLATSGVLERHPDLHAVFVEYNTGWLAWTMETMDVYDRSFRRYDARRVPAPGARPTVYPDLDHPPSWYVRRQIHATFQIDTVGLGNVGHTGAGCLMWGNDFPHEEGTYPHSRQLVDEQSAALDSELARRIFRDNAIDVFRFDRSIIDEVL